LQRLTNPEFEENVPIHRADIRFRMSGSERTASEPDPGRSEPASIRVAAAVVVRRAETEGSPDRILISHRFPNAHLPDFWEFPGGKLEPGESSSDCARREVREETGVEVRVLGLLTRQRHTYPDRVVEIDFHACAYDSGVPVPVQCQAVRWVTAEHLEIYPFPNANREVLAKLDESGWIDQVGE
jgi:8-oxo-dGTP diphosphatase